MPKVMIAPVRQSDAEELIAANIASSIHHVPWAHPFLDRAGFDAWFGQTVTGPNIGLVARDPESGGIVGVVNISQMVWGEFRSAFLGYHGMVGFAGRGFMTEAVRLAVAHAFDAIGLHRVEANIQPGNHPSIALVKRLGFRKEGFSPKYLKIGGVWCDHERWALLSDDPRL
ncbi:GNAT family N-acetyltransferase [Rhizobium lusitanum]|uniref:Ribosomal-protein-alanine N-acetyltransferase n=1 Tax=Rhizobium lusitanum TaxID=293958 RepID=A0A7X0IP07_9HYPH|nr:GNAT family protein [Rhizobium lusitanum]MBB6484214.1 ribosomal-protein-alanine N-acetyltransferase [Rhizobium lusitanum]